MNKIKKVILAVISIFMFVFLFSINDVQARGLVYQTWSMDGLDGALVYREFTTPYEATLKDIRSTTQSEKVAGAPQAKYWNRNAGQYLESKWVYNNGSNNSFFDNHEFGYYNFSSVGLRIYGDFELSNYNSSGSSKQMGYMTIRGNAIGKTLPADIYGSANGVKTYVTAKSGISLENDTKTYDMRDGRFGNPTYVKYSNGTLTYRIALVAPDMDSKDVTPIYVIDRVLSKDMVSAIKAEAFDSTGKTMFHDTLGYKNCLRISSLAKTAANAYNQGEVAIDTANDMKNIAFSDRDYSANSKGLAENRALGSALNLYDNVLVFPEPPSRKVYYRYVNIGTEKQVTARAIENAEINHATAPEATNSNGMYIANYNEFIATEGAAPIDVTTDDKNPYKSETNMEYMGYYVAQSTSKGKAETNISTLVNINSALNPSTTYIAPSHTPTEDEHIVVEIYYRKKTNWETEEHHLMYDEEGNYTGQSGTTVKTNQPENVDTVTYGEDRKITIEGYKYIGMKAANVDLTKDNDADGTVDVGELSTYAGTNSVTLDRENKYAFYAYQKQKAYPINVVHVLYDLQIGTSEIVYTEELRVEEGKPAPRINPLGYEYKGVWRNYTGSGLPPIEGSWNSSPAALQTTFEDKETTIYVGYVTDKVEVIVRHILYDINGDIKEVKHEGTAGTASSYGGVTVRVDNSLKSTYDYKGYLQTMEATYPEKAIAYISEDVCVVESKDLKVKTVYVNFMYKEKVKSEKLDPPDIEIGGNLSVDLIDDPAIDDPKTQDCEQTLFKDKDNRTFTTTSGNKVKLGITDLKTRYIAGIAVKNDVAPKSNLVTYAIIQPHITSYGSKKDGSLKSYPMTINTQYQVYTFIVPYISTKYEIGNTRVYKLANSKIYDTDAGEDTVGPDLLTKTGNTWYNKDYPLNQDVGFNIKKTKKTDYYINFESNNPIEAEISIEGGMESCTDISFHNIDPENPDIYCYENNDSLKTTEIKSTEGLIEAVGTSLKWILGAREEGSNITQLKITAHVYPTEGYEEGVIKTERRIDDKVKNIYYVFDNDTTDVEASIKNWFMRTLQQIINGIKQAIAMIFETDYKETVFWDLEDEAMTSMNVSARNFLQQEDMMLFKLKMVAETSGYELEMLNTKNPERPETVTTIAKTDAEIEKRYFNIDSTNFSMTSRDEVLGIILEEHTFKGNVDLTNIGGMNITPEGKKMYEEGFALKQDLDDGNSTTDNYKDLTSMNSVDAEIKKDAINGIRVLYGITKYITESGSESSTTGTFNDNIYHSSSENPLDTTYYFTSKPDDKTNEYNSSKENSDVINVYTPIKLRTDGLELKGDSIDEEPISQLDSAVGLPTTKLATIESGFHFYVGLSKYNVSDSDSDHKYNNPVDTLRFLKGYYVKFSFDIKDLKVTIADNDTDTRKNEITNVTVSGSSYTGGIIKANTWIYVELPNDSTREDYRIIQVNAKGINTADAKELSYKVRAVANNINRELSTRSFAESRLAFYDTFGNICNDKIDLENIVITDDTPVYYDEITKKVTIEQIDRLFDFRVTDVNDVDWKNVFRNKDTTHNGVAYYVGDKKWVSSKTNPVSRTTKEIGENPITTLPIGPNKNTDITYKKAPKLGYRISFDIKVSGEEKAREVKVKPTFYFVTESGGIENEIKLYYKNDKNAYVPVDNYKLSFTPKDGYRLLESGTEHLSTKEVTLGTVGNITLDYDTMSITAEDYQIFYGEFKLPNTTIVVKKDAAGNYDPTKESNILKDGYIAVKFDITTTYEDTTQELKYDRPMDKKDTIDTKLKKLLVTQWSFEGFLGSRYNSKLNNATIQLENKNKLNISNEDTYEQVIGTVVLFDSDERAASDFN